MAVAATFCAAATAAAAAAAAPVAVVGKGGSAAGAELEALKSARAGEGMLCWSGWNGEGGWAGEM